MAEKTAAICRRGHEISNDVVNAQERLEEAQPGKRPQAMVLSPDFSMPRSPTPTKVVHANCGTCGAPVITTCDSCTTPIPRINHLGGNNQGEPNSFCVGCGQPYPWATREQRIGNLYNLIDFGNLSQAEDLEIVEAIAVLSEPEDASDLLPHVNAGETIKRLAPGAWAIGQPMLASTLSAALQQALHLHGGG